MKLFQHFPVIILLGSIKVGANQFGEDGLEDKDRVVGYRKPCNNSVGPHCNHKGLECIRGICDCKSTTYPDKKLVHIPKSEGCEPIADESENWACKSDIQCQESSLGKNSNCVIGEFNLTGVCECDSTVNPLCLSAKGIVTQFLPPAQLENNWRCTTNRQCTNSELGKFSRCKTGTGFGICECYDSEGRGREVLLVHDVCYLKKDFNHDCSNDMECNATIPGEAVCLGSEGNKKGLCKCAAQHQYEPDYKECLKLGTIDSPCKTHAQCQHEEALGPLSVCDETTKTCKCWDNKESGKWDTKFHDGRCRYSRGLNETCNAKQECELGYHKNADCLEHPSYNGEKVCQCPPGAECKSSGPISCSASMAVTIVGLCSCAYYYSVHQS